MSRRSRHAFVRVQGYGEWKDLGWWMMMNILAEGKRVHAVVSCVSFEGQDTPSPLLVGWRTAKSTTRRFTGGESRTCILVSFLPRYSSPFINLSPFFLRIFGPERKHACSFYVVLITNRLNVLLRQHAAPCLPFNAGHLYMGLYRYHKGIFKTGTEVLSIVLHTSSSNTRSCFECRLKGKTLLLPYL